MTRQATPPCRLTRQLRQHRCGVRVLAPPTRPDNRPVLDALSLQSAEVAGINAALAHTHALSAVLARVPRIRRGNAHIKSRDPAWRSRRGKNIGRAQARGGIKQAEDLFLGSGVRETGQVKHLVVHVVVASGARARSAAEGVSASHV